MSDTQNSSNGISASEAWSAWQQTVTQLAPLLVLKKNPHKDFYDFGAKLVSPAPPQNY